ncbi:hypothetical protein J6590_004913 [Homalodisca vitripennis]|nr:hypothetical protein J6590_004913 [Homalodisca vitripennis]
MRESRYHGNGTYAWRAGLLPLSTSWHVSSGGRQIPMTYHDEREYPEASLIILNNCGGELAYQEGDQIVVDGVLVSHLCISIDFFLVP